LGQTDRKNQKDTIKKLLRQSFRTSKRDRKNGFEDVLPFIKMLNSKVAYAVNRRVVSKEFKQMINECVKQIDSVQKFETFKLFFEAVLGFYKGRD